MAPIPYSAGFSLVLSYTITGYTHHVRLPCDSPDSSAPYTLSLNSGGTRLASSCADDFAQLYKPLMHNTDSFVQYSLQEYDSGIFIPRQTASMAVAGTNGAIATLGEQWTMTFRDLPYHIYRLILFESVLPAPTRINYPSGDANVNALIESILPGSVAANPVGRWLRSRGDNQIKSLTGMVTTYNRKLRRTRGQV